VDQIMKLVAGEALPAPAAESRHFKTGFNWVDLTFFAFFSVPIVGWLARSILGPKLGALATGGAVGALALFITSSLVIAGLAAVAALLYSLFSGGTGGWGAGGGGFSSGGGGGFSSGGGGDFGGGGASGSW
jgi:uncharacterized protein